MDTIAPSTRHDATARGRFGRHRARWGILGLGTAVLLAVAGCTAGTADAASGTSSAFAQASTTIPVAGSAAACVPDAKKVATAKNTQSTKPVSAALAAQYDAALSAVFAKVKKSAPSVIVGVRGPKGTWTHAYGVADLATKTPTTTDMYQRIGSITKTFVATAVLQLAEQKKLSLDDPIDNYVTGVPNGTHITLRELVTMTSGLANYSADPQWNSDQLSDPTAPWTPQQLLAVAYGESTAFPPGTAMQYSNTNYILLGLVIERVTGKSLPEVIKGQILKPLKMKSTAFPLDAAFPSPHPNGYTHALNEILGSSPSNAWGDATNWNPSWGWAAGAMTSNITDLFTWGRALATGQGVLPVSAQVQRLDSFGSSNLGADEYYSDGLMCKNGWIGHGGNIMGYNSMLRYNPAIDSTIVVEATGDSATATPPRLVVDDELASALAKVAGHDYPAAIIPPAGQKQAAEAPDPDTEG